ncbi:MAG: GYDIA family GHMP kinase [Bacteroidota bacterium]
MERKFYSNGKLLLSGEYAILDGALGLAIPTKYGQSLGIQSIEKPVLQWKSIAYDGAIWFEAEFAMNNYTINNTTNSEVAHTLQKLLIEAKRQNPNFLSEEIGIEAIARLTFPREWGLGSSSTLINNIAQWANVDAYQLLWNAFGGSGYDIACAQHDFPISYSVENRVPEVKQAEFNPPFKDSLYFVYLNQKQNSKKAIEAYRGQAFDKKQLVKQLSSITQKMIQTNSLAEFEALIKEHEVILSEVLGFQPVKSRLFPDYNGAIKSLGAWGGDFVLVTADESSIVFFKEKGFGTIFSYHQMTLV